MSATETAAPTPMRWLDKVSPEERRELLQLRPLHSWLMVLSNWGLIFAAMALVARWPNPLTIVFAVCLIGARQLGMAIVMHEAAHRTLFANRKLNDWVGNWLAAYPVWADVAPYRAYHLVHHSRTGTDEDPDLGLAAPFPITKESFRRKLWRDLSGQTGWKQAKAVFRRDVGLSGKPNQRTLGMNRGEQPDVGWHKLIPVATSNGVLLLILTLAGAPWLYLLWVAAWLTTYRLVTRIRSIAEHGMIPDRFDALRNTRTTYANWLERLFLAPNRVNYHLEHHLMMTVPAYNLPRMHSLLRERGILANSPIASGYREVLRLATSRPAAG